MQIVTTFDPSAATTGTFNLSFPGSGGRVLIYNESNINLQLAFSNGYTTYVPGWMAMLYCLHTLTSTQVTWSQQSQLASNGSPISMVVIETFDPNEPVPGTYPAALVRQTNVGNASTALAAATSITNDGQVAGSNVIEATTVGAPSSSVSIDNQGNAFFAQYVGGIVTKLFQTVANAATSVLLGATGKIIEVLGNLKVDGTATVVGTSSLDNGAITTDGTGIISAFAVTLPNNQAIRSYDAGSNLRGILFVNTGGNTVIKMAGTGAHISFQTNGGTSLASFDASGNMIIKGTLTQSGSPF